MEVVGIRVRKQNDDLEYCVEWRKEGVEATVFSKWRSAESLGCAALFAAFREACAIVEQCQRPPEMEQEEQAHHSSTAGAKKRRVEGDAPRNNDENAFFSGESSCFSCFLALPMSILAHTFAFLRLREVVSAAAVCRDFSRAARLPESYHTITAHCGIAAAPVPQLLSRFRLLRRLDLSEQELPEQHVAALRTLTRLESLCFPETRVRYPDSSHFLPGNGDLTLVRHLLSANPLLTDLSIWFKTATPSLAVLPPRLRTFRFYPSKYLLDEDFEVLFASLAEKFPLSLEVLHLSNYVPRQPLEAALRRLPLLTELSLADRVERWGWGNVEQKSEWPDLAAVCPRLRRLSVTNPSRRGGLPVLSDLKSLTDLSVPKPLPSGSLPPSLTRLSFVGDGSYSSSDTMDPTAISTTKLPNLTELRCGKHDISGELAALLAATARLRVLRLPRNSLGSNPQLSEFCAAVCTASEEAGAQGRVAWEELEVTLINDEADLSSLQGKLPFLTSLTLSVASTDVALVVPRLLPYFPALRSLALSVTETWDSAEFCDNDDCERMPYIRGCLGSIVGGVSRLLRSEVGRRLSSLQVRVSPNAVTSPSACSGVPHELRAIAEALVKDGGTGTGPVAASALRYLSLNLPQASDASDELIGRLGQAGITAVYRVVSTED